MTKVTVRRGRFNWASPQDSRDICISVVVHDSGEQNPTFNVSFVLPEDGNEDLLDREYPWGDLVQDAAGRWLKNTLYSSKRDAVESLFRWLSSDRNKNVLNLSWARDREDSIRAQIQYLQKRLEDLQSFRSGL